MKRNKGITLIALVITIIVLLILAGISISLVLGDNGIIQKGKSATEKYRAAEQEEIERMEEVSKYLEKKDNGWNSEKKVNKPVLRQGMTPVKFIRENDSTPAKIVPTTEDSDDWYDYENQQWANAQTEDGSLWVWIPRYAYKIPAANYHNKTSGIIDIKFLIGTTDNYYDEDNNLQEAYRCQTADEIVNTSEKFVVHPAFADETEIGWRNGGWDSELTGIWVAKFEAGYANAYGPEVETTSSTPTLKNENNEDVKVKSADNKNTTLIKASSVKYTKSKTNWYGSYTSNTTFINYPVFQGSTYSINFISINDIYNLCQVMTEDGNIYGLKNDTDSHLIKKSEWGAVAYLAQSNYGYKGKNPSATDILANTKNKNNNPSTVYCVTGYNNASKEWNNGGEGASTSGTIYGIYDMSGGLWEYCTAYIATGHANLKSNGKSVTYETVNNSDVLKTQSTKYTTVYPYNNPEHSTFATAQQQNYSQNTKIYGDAVRETSNAGTGNNSWNGDYSLFVAQNYTFIQPGGGWGTGNNQQGLFCFGREIGDALYDSGFRPVLVNKN